MMTETITDPECEENFEKRKKKWARNKHKRGSGKNHSCVYFLGMIGAAVFYISASTSFWGGMLGFLKALVWPAFMVYEAFSYLSSVA